MTSVDINIKLPYHIAKQIVENDDHGMLRDEWEYEIPVGNDMNIVVYSDTELSD